MKCNSPLSLDEVQPMLYSSFGSSRRNSCPGKISMTRTWLCSLLLLTWTKRFDRVPRKVLWWAMRKVGVEEWIVRLVQAMYNNARPIDGRPFKEVEVGDCVLEAVDRFCYMGDMLSAGGGCMAAATARCRCAWGTFRETFLCSRPSPCLSNWGVVCLALMYVVQCYMVRKLGPWLPTPFTDCVITIVLWSAGFVGSSRRMTHQSTICMPS